MEISDAVGIRIREDNKGNNKEDMDSKNLFFLKFMLRFTHRRYIMIASHKLKRYQGKGIKIPLRTVAASFYIFWPGAYPVKRSGSASDILYTYVYRYKALNHSFRYLCWFCGVLSSGSRSFCPFPKRIGIHHQTQFRPVTLCDAVSLEAAKQFFHNEDLKNNSILCIFVKILSFLCCIFLKYC